MKPKSATIKTVTYKSSNKNIAHVDSTGKITAKKVGSANIIVQATDGSRKSARITVNVGKAPKENIRVESIDLTTLTDSIIIGERIELIATITPSSATNKKIIWATSDSSVATVVDGKVTGVGEGKVVITVTTDDGNKADYVIIHVNKVISPIIIPVPTSSNDKEENNKEIPTSPSDEEKVSSLLNADYENLYIEYYVGDTSSSVTHDIILNTLCDNGSTVVWESLDSNVIDEDGKVYRSNTSSQDVVLYAKLNLNGETMVKCFNLTVACVPNINAFDIEDLSITDLQNMNINDDNSNIEVNEYGYLESIYGQFSDVYIDSYEAALYSLYSVKTAIGITNPFDELEVISANVDETGSIYKFVQIYKGIPVYDNIVVVSANADGTTDFLLSNFYPIVNDIEVTPILSYSEASNYLYNLYQGISIIENENQNELYVSNYYGNTDLVWSIYFEVYDSECVLDAGEYEALISTINGELIYLNCTTLYSSNINVDGNDLNGNSRSITVRKNTYLFADADYTLEDRDRRIYLYDAGESVTSLSNSNIIKNSNSNDWTSEQISAMANMKDTYDFYKNTFNRISYDNAYFQWTGNKIKVYLNSGVTNNAYWSGSKKIIVIGEGTDNIFKHTSLAAGADVLCHEFTHAVVNDETSLGKINYGTPGTINEAYADIFACFQDNDWQIGEDVAQDDCLRDIENPSNTNNPSTIGGDFYIDYKTDDTDRAGIHKNSTIISHAAYLMHTYGMSMDTLKKLWYKSLCLGYKKHSDFYDVRLNVLKAAQKLNLSNAEIKNINDVFDTVNILKSNCDENKKSYFNDLDKVFYMKEYFNESINCIGKVVEVDSDTLNSNNIPLSNVDVSVFSFDKLIYYSQMYTDSYGKYDINIAIDDKYMLTYEKEDYFTEIMYLDKINPILQTEYYCDIVELIPTSLGGIGVASGKIISAVTAEGIPKLTINIRKGINNIYTDIIGSLETDSNGQYLIDYLSAGNYCLEIVDNRENSDDTYISSYINIKVLGNTIISEQNGMVSTTLSNDQIRMVLTWGSSPRDLDAHMICNFSDLSVNEVYYGNKECYKDGTLVCMLDIDELNGYGPETITLYNSKTGIYTFYVHNYSGEKDIATSGASVKIYISGNGYPSYVFNIPNGSGRYWTVFQYNSATKKIVPVNIVSYFIEE